MNAYKLDDKAMDECFLKGESVICEAVLSAADHDVGLLNSGERIVVLLSSGKKYMGEIRSFNFSTSANHLKGKLEIVRYPKI